MIKIRVFFFIVCLIFCYPNFAQNQFSYTTDSNIYVIGDIHGAYDEVVSTLKILYLIDQENNWSGGSAHFVSLGDLVDRGPATRKVMDLFMKLQNQAESAGGKFHIILGNHELMNLKGDWRYLSEDEINEFAEDETIEQRNLAFTSYIEWHQLPENPLIRDEFDRKYPAGFFARMAAFNLTGKYGKWLVELPYIIKINQQLFAHGGLSKKLKNTELTTLNTELADELITYIKSWNYFVENKQLAFDTPFRKRAKYVKSFIDSSIKTDFLNTHKSLAFSKMGPTWYRGSALCHPYFEQDILFQKLKYWDANRLWVGHTTTPKQNVQERFSNRLVMMDTGMLNAYYHGQPWAAQIEQDGSTTYINGLTSDMTSAIVAPKREYSNPYNLNDAEVEKFLMTAEIKEKTFTKDGRTNPYKLTLTKDGITMNAIFKYVDTHHLANRGPWKKTKEKADRYQYEIAAYKLDRLLGIGLVPVTIERKVNGISGVLQIWLDGLISSLAMNDNNIYYSGFCDPMDQVNMMNTYDYLIANRDRNQSNIMYTREDWQIWFIDHSRAFGTSVKRPKIIKNLNIKLSHAFKEALEELQLEQLQELKPWLHNKQIKAIWKRRNLMIEGKF